MSKFTPGPWVVMKGVYTRQMSVSAEKGNGFYVHLCEMAVGTWDSNCEANARLIAAAPEMHAIIVRYLTATKQEDLHNINADALTLLNRINQ